MEGRKETDEMTLRHYESLFIFMIFLFFGSILTLTVVSNVITIVFDGYCTVCLMERSSYSIFEMKGMV